MSGIGGIDALYESGIKVQRYTEDQSTASGEIVKAWTDHLSISGRIIPIKGSERLSDSANTLFADFRLYCPSTDILETDRIIKSSITYQVVNVETRQKPNSTLGHIEADLRLIR